MFLHPLFKGLPRGYPTLPYALKKCLQKNPLNFHSLKITKFYGDSVKKCQDKKNQGGVKRPPPSLFRVKDTVLNRVLSSLHSGSLNYAYSPLMYIFSHRKVLQFVYLSLSTFHQRIGLQTQNREYSLCIQRTDSFVVTNMFVQEYYFVRFLLFI